MQVRRKEVKLMSKVLLVFLISLLLFSCKTKYIPVETVKVKKEYITRTDSVFIKDSVDVRERIINDTVFIEKLKYRDRFIAKHDTIFRTDSIPVIKIVEVEKKVGLFDRVKAVCFGAFLILVIFCLYNIKKWFG